MYQGKTFLAIIPARSGSKRLPNKNIKKLFGKPLIAWSIEAGLNCPYIDEVVVSTDSQEYAEIARQYGAKVPFLRPKELAQDTTTTFDSIKHTIDCYQSQLNKSFDYIILLQPTSPLRNFQHICEAINTLFVKRATSIISICPCEHSPLWSNTLPSDHSMDYFLNPTNKGVRSQELPAYYRLNGAIYIAETHSLLANQSFFTPNSYAFIMDTKISLDIDTEYEFHIAEMLIRQNYNLLGGGDIN